MLRFNFLGIPVVVEGWFWLTAILLGGGVSAGGPEAWKRVAVRVGVIFLSILVHELGHAFAGLKFGAQPAIKLHGFGGSTYLPGGRFSRGQNIIVSAAGPLGGLLLWAATLLVWSTVTDLPPLARTAISTSLYVNLSWTLFNLLPIQPMDGGQILREVLGPGRERITSVIGGVLAVAVGVWALTNRQPFMAFILAMMAYHNFRRDPVEGGVIKPSRFAG